MRSGGIAYNSRRLLPTRSQAAPYGSARPLLAEHRCGLQFPAQAKQFACSALISLRSMRSGGIEPPPAPWQGAVLPLNYDREILVVLYC